MFAAISLVVILTISMVIVRTASVALRHTGLPDAVARFQCLSAFTGSGFTTSETEQIVNYPIRRKVISWLMIIGNLGLASVIATLVISLASGERTMGSMVTQIVWLGGGAALIWVVMLNPRTDAVMCALIGRILDSTTELGRRQYVRTLQVADGYSVVNHVITEQGAGTLGDLMTGTLRCLAVHHANGADNTAPGPDVALNLRDVLIVYGAEADHDALEVALGHPQPRGVVT